MATFFFAVQPRLLLVLQYLLNLMEAEEGDGADEEEEEGDGQQAADGAHSAD